MTLRVSQSWDEITSVRFTLNGVEKIVAYTIPAKLLGDGDIEGGESFNQSMSEKLDQAIQTLTDIKGSIDNEVVSLFNGEGVSGGDDGMDDGSQFDVDSLDDSDLASDFNDESVPEFNPDEESADLEGLDDLGEEPREEK